MRRSEEKYRELVQNANSIILKIDPEGRIAFLNEFAAGFFGFEDCDVIGRSVVGTIISDSDMTHDDLIETISNIAVNPSEYSNFENRNILCSGEKVWISWNKKPVYDDNGNLLEIICIGNDVTARKTAEEALKYQVAFEKIIADTATNFINLPSGEMDNGINNVLEQIGEFTDVDRSYVFLFSDDAKTMSNTHEWCHEGIEPQQDKLQNIPSDYLGWWMKQIKRAATINLHTLEDLPPEAEPEKKLLREQKIISLLVVPLINSDTLIGFLGFDSVRKEKFWSNEDITLLKMVAEIIIIAIQKSLAVKNLEDEQAQLLSIFDSIDEAIYVVDPETDEILYLNKCLADNLGKNPVGGICYQEFQGLDRKCDFCTNDIILKDPSKPYLWEYHNPVINSDFMIVDRIIKWPDGRDVRFEIAVDITDKKQLELERARAANLESLGILAGGIAHDFNNILTAVLGNISLLKYLTPGAGKIQQLLGNTEKAGLRAQELTQQLLTFSKGGVPIKKCASISQLVKESVDFVLSGSNSKCEFEIADDLWMADVDEGQINQVFNNIIINANQSMPEGGIINIRMVNVDNFCRNRSIEPLEGNYVKISIEDHGTGISEDHLKRIFDPYFTTKQDGSGLGLATAYSIIKKHSGYISVKSSPGKGSIFDIYFPASFDKAEQDVEADDPKCILHGRILIMDDEEVVRQTTEMMLTTLGMEVEHSRDGDEAISKYRLARESGRPFDAVILDLTIPGGMGGKETVKELRNIDPDVRAIVSSGYSNDAVMSDYSDYGFSDMVIKPYRIAQMKEVLTRILKSQ